MGIHIWGYWDCPYCGTKGIRGDNEKCPYCGMQIPPDTTYYIKDDVEEEVEESRLNDEASWVCEYCDTLNQAWADHCFNCGSPRSEATRDYFGNGLNGHPSRQQQYAQPAAAPQNRSMWDMLKKHKLLVFALIAMVFTVWITTPVTRSATIKGFEWERSIAIEEYKNVDENDWTLPSNANLHTKKQEIKSYKQVIDHYETKTKKVAHQVQDGYDTDYKDLGNGQFEKVKTPRYRTEYKTEKYKEPVYRNEPVYATKYYYDIDKWVEVDSSDSKGSGKEPYWNETGLPESVSDPKYGDRKSGARRATYYAVIVSEKDGEYRKDYPFEQWQALSEGDKIKYKTSRFSDKPLG